MFRCSTVVPEAALSVMVSALLWAGLLMSSTAQQALRTAVSTAASCYNASSAPDYLCPPDVASLRLPHETSCAKYYVCENGKATEMCCAGSFRSGRRFFSTKTQSCGRSSRSCRSNPRVLIRNVTACRPVHSDAPGLAGATANVCPRPFVPYPNVANATGVLVCNEDGSAYLAHCPLTSTGIQTVFINGKCRLRQLLRGRYKWERLLRSPGLYPPNGAPMLSRVVARSRAGIRPLATSDERVSAKKA
uniref:Uncharacterized protein n=1 Tax=Anopheles atroparvus TaxID=41427 RepID=A0A182JIT6_ANOAO